MKKFKKVLSAAAVASLFLGGAVTLASCNGGSEVQTNVKASDLVGRIIINESGTKVTDSFTVPAVVIDDNGNEHDLTWESDNKVLKFELDAEKKVYNAVVTRPAADSENEYTLAHFSAKVTVNNETAETKKFNVRVRRQMTPEEQFEDWLTNIGSTQSFEGYIIAKLGYVDQHKEANLILWNPTVKGGYLAYNGYLDKEVYDSVELGTFASVKGATSQLYNGLIETKYGCTIAVDTSKKISLSEATRTDMTEALLKGDLVEDNGSPTLAGLKLQNTFVSLKGFTVTDVSKKFDSASGKYGTTMQTIATLTRAGKQVKVCLAEGMTPFAAPATKTLYTDLTKVIKVGTKVDLDGILSWNDGPVILVDTKDAVKVSKETDNDYDKSYAAAKTVAGTLKGFYGSNTEVTLPATAENGSTLTYKIVGNGYKVENGKLVITPTENSQRGTLTITAKSGTVENKIVVIMNCQLMTDAEAAQKVADELKIDDISVPGNLKLVDSDDVFGATIAWAIKDGQGVATAAADGVITVIPTTEDKTIVLTATVTVNGTAKTKDVSVKVKGHTLTTVEEALAGKVGTYVWLEGYVTETLDSNGSTYLSSTPDGTNKIQIYKLKDVTGKDYSKFGYTIPKGAKVVVYEAISEYKGNKQLQNAKLISYVVSDDTIAENNVNAAAALFSPKYIENSAVTLPEGVTATVTTGATASVADGKVTIVPTETEVEVKITLSSKVGDVTKTKEVTFKTKIAEFCELKANVTTAGNHDDGDITALMTTNDKLTITASANSSQNTVYLKSGQIRLYNGTDGNGCAITITAKEGSSIASIIVNYDEGADKATVTAGETALTGTGTKSVSYDVNGQSVTIKNTATSGQARIGSIKVIFA